MKNKNTLVLVTEFVDGVNKASKAAHQMVHSHQDPRFLPLRDLLEKVRDKSLTVAMKVHAINIEDFNARN